MDTNEQVSQGTNRQTVQSADSGKKQRGKMRGQQAIVQKEQDELAYQEHTHKKNGWWSLSPLFVFLCLYLVTSILLKDFYKLPITVAFAIASCYAILITTDLPLEQRITRFSLGAGNKNIMLMVWIFILAGAFAQSAKNMGAIDSIVNLTLTFLPSNLILAGVFIASCVISLSIGTSVGTIAALVPVAVGLAEKTQIDLGFLIGIVVGGSFFGDNLSFISDTTIAATRTQGCRMKDKFKVNSLIVAPAALLILCFYVYEGLSITSTPLLNEVDWIKTIPYFLVLSLAFAGLNVLLVLVLGMISSGMIGWFYDTALINWMSTMGDGIMEMAELILVTLLAGGLLEIIRYNGGIDFIIAKLTSKVKNKVGAELSIAGLVSLANLCTANNTIAIITTGSIAKSITRQYQLNPKKTASILDTLSCMVQGIIPYGAQTLIAAGLAGLSPLDITKNLYYPVCIGVSAILAIIFRLPKRYS